MMLHEHIAGSIVKIYKKGHDEEFYQTKSHSSIESNPIGHLICEPVSDKGVKVNIKGSGWIVEVIDAANERSFIYESTNCGHIDWKGTPYFVVVSQEDVTPYNRRSEFRVSLVTGANVQVRTNSKVRPCYLVNVSQTGLGFTIMKDEIPEISIGDFISMSFTADPNLKHYHVFGNIVRVEESELNDSIYSVGVKLNKESSDSSWYTLVALTQRKQLQKSRK